jgi:hypothetical protein
MSAFTPEQIGELLGSRFSSHYFGDGWPEPAVASFQGMNSLASPDCYNIYNRTERNTRVFIGSARTSINTDVLSEFMQYD